MTATLGTRDGGYLCGAVRFTVRDVPASIGACHRDMSRRWTGTALPGVSVPEGNVIGHGAEMIARMATSDWAERAFCRRCASGLFDDRRGFKMTSEIYIDEKPDCYAHAGDGRKLMTRQECLEEFSVLGND